MEAGEGDYLIEAIAPEATSKPEGEGTLTEVMADHGMLGIRHEPIEALGWPAMTMNFSVAPAVDLAGYKAGQAVHFTLEKQANGSYVITEMMSMGGMQH